MTVHSAEAVPPPQERRRWGIGARLAVSVGVILLVVVSAMGAALWTLSVVTDRAVEAVDEADSEVIPLLEVAGDVNETALWLGRVVFDPGDDPAATTALRERVAATNTAISTLASSMEGFTEEGADIDRGFASWSEAREGIDRILEEGPAPSETVAVFDALDEAEVALSDAAATAKADLDVEIAAAQSERVRVSWVLVLVLAAAAVGGALIVLRLRRVLARPIGRLRDGAARVADGDLGHPIDVDGPAELAELSTAFNTMTGELLKREAQLVHQAHHDALTGVGNQVLLNERLDHALARLRRQPDGQLAVLAIELDDYKKVNDTLGHVVGDEALVVVAGRLRASLHDDDTLCRTGADKFVVVAEGVGEAAMGLATRIREVVSEEIEIGGRAMTLGCRVGVTVAEHGFESTVDLLRDADLALYRARGEAGNAIQMFDRAFYEAASKRLDIEAELRTALERGDLEVHYQPTLELGSGRVAGVEALVRWRHPDRGLLPPVEFLPVAEDTGLVVPLGWHVLRTALSDLRRWLDNMPAIEPFTLSVNVAAEQLATTDFVDRVREELTSAGVAAENLALEVTETAVLVDSDGVRANLDGVRALGVRVALDDFGTGYSSLQHLREYEVDIIKIDRSFVSELCTRADLVTFVRAIVELADQLSLEVVAEGIEDDEVVRALVDLGCGLGQGYFFARPAPAEEVEWRLSDGAVPEPAPSGSRR